MPEILEMSKEMRNCITACLECYITCNETSIYCIQTGGEHAEKDHIRLMMDCASICNTCADVMLRGSGYSEKLCSICADVCEMCSKSCEKLLNDPVMKQCFEVCHRCAKICREM